MPGRKALAGWAPMMLALTSRGISNAGAARDGRATPPIRETPDRPGLAPGITVGLLGFLVAVQLITQRTAPFPAHGPALVMDTAAVIALFMLTTVISLTCPHSWSGRRRLAVLLAEGLLTYLPLAIIGRPWTGMTGFLAGSAALLLTGGVGWAVFGGAVASMLAFALAAQLGPYTSAYLTASAAVFGLVVFGTVQLNLIIQRINARSSELTQLALINERMRIARDLHDLLGYSLSAIILKAEFTRRMVASDPCRARDELAEMVDIARQATADVRIVASGYRSISLAKEASPVSSLLAASGISTTVDISCGPLDERTDTVLATVLREAVTNMLGHSKAQNCVIQARIRDDLVRLLIANDGMSGPASPGRYGSGLENLCARMASIGGRLTTGVRDDGWFTVLAEAPQNPPAAAEAPGPGSSHLG